MVIPADHIVAGGYLGPQSASCPFVERSEFFVFIFLFVVKWQHGKLITLIPEIRRQCYAYTGVSCLKFRFC